jgi:putative flavoprotein involved in K+ transport
MTMDQVVRFIADYAIVAAAPVRTATRVVSVQAAAGSYRVVSDRGLWRCRAVVIASGACNLPTVPAVSAAVPAALTQLTPSNYRNPAQLEPGGVLVVGASATGVQLADEIRQAGHEVTLAVGEHVRMPREYRGRDIQWWMQSAGIWDQRYDQADDINRARQVPSPQLAGCRDRRFMDLNALASRGVRIVGRLAAVRDGKALFSGSLANVCALADLKMNRLLAAFDEWAVGRRGAVYAGPPERFEPTRVPVRPALDIDLKGGAIRTVIWATGYRPDYSWLRIPVLDRKGWIRHDGGVAASPGLYVLGLPFLRRRKSSFIHGAGDDARELSEHLAVYLDELSRRHLARRAG